MDDNPYAVAVDGAAQAREPLPRPTAFITATLVAMGWPLALSQLVASGAWILVPAALALAFLAGGLWLRRAAPLAFRRLSAGLVIIAVFSAIPIYPLLVGSLLVAPFMPLPGPGRADPTMAETMRVLVLGTLAYGLATTGAAYGLGLGWHGLFGRSPERGSRRV